MIQRLFPTRRPVSSQWSSRRERLRYGLIIALFLTPLIGLVAGLQLFEQANLGLTNLLYVSFPLSDTVAIVAIDDLSLGKFGRSVADWSRERHAQLIRTLSAGGARVIVFDVLFDAPTPNDQAMADAIADARKAGTRVVLAISGRQGTQLNTSPAETLHYRGVLRPVEAFQEAGAALGHVNVTPDSDGYVRALPFVMESGDPVSEQWFSLSAAAYLSYLRISYAQFGQVAKVGDGQVQLTGQRKIPVDSAKRLLTNFFGASGAFPNYSFAAVHDGEINPNLFKDKVVFVGALNATGVTDRYLVPIERGNLMAGVEIHANALETILQSRALVRQPMALAALFGMLIAIAGSLVFTQLGARMLILSYAASLVVIFLVASLLFSFNQYILALIYPVLALTLAGIGALISNIRLESRRRQRVQTLLDSLGRLGEQRLLLTDILPRLSSEILGLSGGNGAAIWIWDEEHHDPVRAYGSLHLSEKQKGLIPATPSRTAIQTIGWNSYDLDAFRAIDQHQSLQANQALIVPLYFQNQPVGAIGATHGEKPFNREQLALLHIFGENAAPLLANAKLYTGQLQQKELIESILASSPDPILVLDDQQRVMRSNLSAQQLFAELGDGTPDLGALLRNVGVDQKVRDDISKTLNNDLAFEHEVSFGERHFVLLGAPLQINENSWVLEMNNISTLKELDALKTQMIRMASHDLKNPLGVILGYTDLLLGGRGKDPERFLRMIDTAARQMQAIINDILNIERLRAGRLDLELSDMGELLTETFEEYHAQAEEKAQTFTLRRPRYALMMLLDKRQLKEAISNLIGNAIKYTPKEGAVTVSLEQKENWLYLSIQDTGYGIPKDAQANLFKPFYRVRTKDTASIPGTGLGLSLVKAVIEAHGGKIWLDSDEGKGSIFHVELPIKLPEEGK